MIARERQARADHVGRRAAAARAEARRGAGAGAQRGERGVHQPARAGTSRAFLDQWLAGFGMPAHLSYDAEAPLATIAANRASYGVAWPKLDFAAAKLIVSFGADFLDGWGASRPAAARLRRRARQARRRAAVRLRRRAPLAHGPQRRQWIAVQAGQRARDRQRARRQGVGRSRRATDARRRRGCARSALAHGARSDRKPSLVLAGGTGADAPTSRSRSRRSTRRAATSASTIKPAEAITAFDGHVAAPASCAPPSRRMRAGQVAHRLRPRRQPGVLAARRRRSSPRRSRRCRSRSSSRAIRTRRRSSAISSFRIITRSSPGATPSRCAARLAAAAGDGSRVSTHAWRRRRADRRGEEGSVDGGEVPGRRYRAWLIAAFPAARRRSANGAAQGHRRRHASPARGARGAAPLPRPHGAAHRSPAPRATSSSSRIPSPALGDGRGANKPWLQELPDPVTKIAGDRGRDPSGDRGATRHRARRFPRRSRRRTAPFARRPSCTSACTRTRSRLRAGRGTAPPRSCRSSSPSTTTCRRCSGATAATRATSASTRSTCCRRRRTPRAASRWTATKASISQDRRQPDSAEQRRLGAPARPRDRAGDHASRN